MRFQEFPLPGSHIRARHLDRCSAGASCRIGYIWGFLTMRDPQKHRFQMVSILNWSNFGCGGTPMTKCQESRLKALVPWSPGEISGLFKLFNPQAVENFYYEKQRDTWNYLIFWVNNLTQTHFFLNPWVFPPQLASVAIVALHLSFFLWANSCNGSRDANSSSSISIEHFCRGNTTPFSTRLMVQSGKIPCQDSMCCDLKLFFWEVTWT